MPASSDVRRFVDVLDVAHDVIDRVIETRGLLDQREPHRVQITTLGLEQRQLGIEHDGLRPAALRFLLELRESIGERT